jgi:multidrug efflux pump subunit AcrB
MNMVDYFLKNRVVTYLFIVLLIGGGWICYEQLGRLEDPEFTIKEAQVITEYPGATPSEVEEEVTDLLENAIQQLSQIKRITSESKAGTSTITVTIKDKFGKKHLPQVWDELRRKVNDAQKSLPPGAGPSLVNDDYGDVYGIIFGIQGKGFTYAEIKKVADFLRKELLLVTDVAKVTLQGVQPEVVYVEFSSEKMSALGISKDTIAQALKNQNSVVSAGRVRVGDDYVRIETTGNFDSIADIEDTLLQGIDRATGKSQVFLKDVATITRGYQEPSKTIVRFNSEPAIVLGLSTAEGGNVVRMGEAVKQRLKELKFQLPAGIELSVMSYQSDTVTKSIRDFIISFLEALAIVIIVLFICMGWRSGLLIALTLIFTVFGTFIFMYLWGINLERISLGALIIALGMLVDNAVVITEGALVGVERGEDVLSASRHIVSQTFWPLLGGTVIGILAFSGIGLSNDNTGEYCRSLFQVILISLFLSWFLAMTLTPFLCELFFQKSVTAATVKDPYAGPVYTAYRLFLEWSLNHKPTVGLVMILLLGAGFFGFGFVKQSFFPDSTRDQFFIDYRLPEGTYIDVVDSDLKTISTHLKTIPGITDVASIAGTGNLRFMLTYKPEKADSAYGQLLVSVDSYKNIDALSATVTQYLNQNFPNAKPEIRKFVLGTGGGATIVARFRGHDTEVLRKLSEQTQQIMYDNGNAKYISDNWREMVPVIHPIFSQTKARTVGIERSDLNNALQTYFVGKQIGFYREADILLPIIDRSKEWERNDVNNINNVEIYSPITQKMIPIRQVVNDFQLNWENALIQRRNRLKTIEVMCDPKHGVANDLFKQLRPHIENIPLPVGYTLEWGGEHGDSHDAKVALIKGLILSFLFICIIIVLLFNAIKQSTIILLTIPLLIIGVTAGLLLTHQAFGFMALLGLLSLVGMVIRNAIVLIDEIDIQARTGKTIYTSIIDASISRMRPVMMGAITTVLGMSPLVTDAFFAGMAVTIMFGLTFATVLTLVVVPVLYGALIKQRETSTETA